jgi:hypothetical protein
MIATFFMIIKNLINGLAIYWIINDAGPDIISYMVLISLFSISGLMYFIFFILAIVALILFFVGRYEYGPAHNRNVKWAAFFMSGYLVLFILGIVVSFFLGFFIMRNEFGYISLTSLSLFIEIMQGFFLVLMIFLPLIALADPREKDMLYTFATVLIILEILYAINTIAVMANDEFYMFYMTYFVFFSFITIPAWLLVFFTCRRLNKRIKSEGRQLPISSSRFLPRIKPLDRYVYQFYSRPLHALVIFLVIGVLVAASAAVSIDVRWYNDEPFYIDDGTDYVDDGFGWYFEDSGVLEEGESIEIFCRLGNFDSSLNARLAWTDENDAFRRQNQPDGFTLEISFAGETQSASAENPEGETGEIRIEFDLDPNMLEDYDSGVVTITLDYAGDQTGPIGLPISPLTIEDYSNSYEIKTWSE